MGILSRLVTKQVNILLLSVFVIYSIVQCTYIKWTDADMEIPKVMGGILEVCAVDKTTVIWHFASGIISLHSFYQELIIIIIIF